MGKREMEGSSVCDAYTTHYFAESILHRADYCAYVAREGVKADRYLHPYAWMDGRMNESRFKGKDMLVEGAERKRFTCILI
jgi:hypothetical protein